MTIALWIAQILLALANGLAGFVKTFRPIPDLAAMMKWPGDYPPALTRFVGIVELAAAVGLSLPVATGILPWLTPLAALGVAAIQVLAIGFHAMRGETQQTIIANLILLALSLFILWGYWPLLGL
jgi:hypothetical protein